MKYFVGLMLVSGIFFNAEAAHLSLAKIDQASYEVSTPKIKKAIADDDTKQEIMPFNKEQSFLLTDASNRKIGYLIPIKFNSQSYRNTICRLFFWEPQKNNLRHAELLAKKNDGDDVASTCIGVEAVSILNGPGTEVYYLAVIRYRTINHYGSTGAIVTYKDGILFTEEKINRCISSQGETASIKSLKKKLQTCM
jgi:hypothetical protein